MIAAMAMVDTSIHRAAPVGHQETRTHDQSQLRAPIACTHVHPRDKHDEMWYIASHALAVSFSFRGERFVSRLKRFNDSDGLMFLRVDVCHFYAAGTSQQRYHVIWVTDKRFFCEICR